MSSHPCPFLIELLKAHLKYFIIWSSYSLNLEYLLLRLLCDLSSCLVTLEHSCWYQIQHWSLYNSLIFFSSTWCLGYLIPILKHCCTTLAIFLEEQDRCLLNMEIRRQYTDQPHCLKIIVVFKVFSFQIPIIIHPHACNVTWHCLVPHQFSLQSSHIKLYWIDHQDHSDDKLNVLVLEMSFSFSL